MRETEKEMTAERLAREIVHTVCECALGSKAMVYTEMAVEAVETMLAPILAAAPVAGESRPDECDACDSEASNLARMFADAWEDMPRGLPLKNAWSALAKLAVLRLNRLRRAAPAPDAALCEGLASEAPTLYPRMPEMGEYDGY